METIQTFTVSAKEVTVGKQKFCACVAQIAGKWYKVKFNREVKKSPNSRGLYDVTIDVNNCSVQNGKLYTKKDGTQGREAPTIWVKEITNIRKWTDEEMAARNMEKVASVFEGEPLPF